ncbi:MAG: hypothetical protein QXH80_02685, partial [Candidatus Nanoarchaeia archaeon]
MKAYTPSINRIREEWLRSRKKANHIKNNIPSNSENWFIDSPKSIGELCHINSEIAKLSSKWKIQQK